VSTFHYRYVNGIKNAAAASHTHAASDVTSGTLAVARGGTGATTAAEACSNLGVLRPTLLYSNSTGTTGSVTLSETAANFDHILIIYTANSTGFGSSVGPMSSVVTQDKCYVSLNAIYAAADTLFQFRTSTAYVDGKSITRGLGGYCNLSTSSNNYEGQISYSGNGINIIRVVGFK
jgi:hypothetical protein